MNLMFNIWVSGLCSCAAVVTDGRPPFVFWTLVGVAAVHSLRAGVDVYRATRGSGRL